MSLAHKVYQPSKEQISKFMIALKFPPKHKMKSVKLKLIKRYREKNKRVYVMKKKQGITRILEDKGDEKIIASIQVSLIAS